MAHGERLAGRTKCAIFMTALGSAVTTPTLSALLLGCSLPGWGHWSFIPRISWFWAPLSAREQEAGHLSCMIRAVPGETQVPAGSPSAGSAKARAKMGKPGRSPGV